jgi:hypothetical protein
MHMRRKLTLLLGTSALFFLTSTLAAPRDYLFRNERLCDPGEVFCLSGTLTYQSNPRLLHLRARVQSAPGPGLLRISLTGTNQQGHRHFAPFEVRVRGRYSEIIDHKIIPDHPSVQGWAIERVEFIADEDH